MIQLQSVRAFPVEEYLLTRLAFSPDERRLYVAQSDPDAAIWRVFDVKSDGTLENSRVLFDATSMVKGRKGLPDGLKIDTEGNLFGLHSMQ